jgi:hypothetical protein
MSSPNPVADEPKAWAEVTVWHKPKAVADGVIIGPFPSELVVRYTPEDIDRLEGAARAKHPSVQARLRVRNLHALLQRLEPETHLWRLLTDPALERFSDQPDLLRRAWDPESDVLLDEAVYRSVLDLTEASRVARREAWSRYWQAVHALRAAGLEDGHARTSPVKPRQWFGDKIPPQTLWELVVERVQVIDDEDVLLEHLKMMMDLSGHSTRTLHIALKRHCEHPPSHTTISNWLNAKKIPRLLTEKILTGMVTVFAEELAPGTGLSTAGVVGAHVSTYRRLIVGRNTERFDAGAVPRALAALEAQEAALAPDDPARQHVRLARDALQRAVTADRQNPGGADTGPNVAG